MGAQRQPKQELADLTEETLETELRSLAEDIENWNHGHPLPEVKEHAR